MFLLGLGIFFRGLRCLVGFGQVDELVAIVVVEGIVAGLGQIVDVGPAVAGDDLVGLGRRQGRIVRIVFHMIPEDIDTFDDSPAHSLMARENRDRPITPDPVKLCKYRPIKSGAFHLAVNLKDIGKGLGIVRLIGRSLKVDDSHVSNLMGEAPPIGDLERLLLTVDDAV